MATILSSTAEEQDRSAFSHWQQVRREKKHTESEISTKGQEQSRVWGVSSPQESLCIKRFLNTHLHLSFVLTSECISGSSAYVLSLVLHSPWSSSAAGSSLSTLPPLFQLKSLPPFTRKELTRVAATSCHTLTSSTTQDLPHYSESPFPGPIQGLVPSPFFWTPLLLWSY